jgi:hypothetical protein
MRFQKSFSVKDINNMSNLKKQIQKKVKIQIVGKQIVSSGQSGRLNIAQANNILIKKQVSHAAGNPSEADSARMLLEAIGVSIPEKRNRRQQESDFSLLNKNRPDADGGNPNIEDPNLRDLENYQEEVSDVFTNEADPFYELDADRPRKDKLRQHKINKMRKQKAIVSLAANLARTNLNEETPSLKYFK